MTLQRKNHHFEGLFFYYLPPIFAFCSNEKANKNNDKKYRLHSQLHYML